MTPRKVFVVGILYVTIENRYYLQTISMQDTAILSLLQKYIRNECSREELQTLFQWLKSSDDYSGFDQVIRPFWDSIDQNMRVPEKEHEDKLRKEVFSLLSEIKQKNEETNNPGVISKNRLSGFYRIVAILILVLSATIGVLTFYSSHPETISFQEQVSAKGEKKIVRLADGTKVILNSDTKLRIPSDFNGESRTVEMEGEGFFDVTSNPDKPFIIKSGGTQVKVLGTSFDFKSYKEDDYIKLTVSTGKVRINVDDQDLQLSVSPNEHLSINKRDGDVNKESIDENNYIKWIQGSLYFKREPIREVLNTINRTYNRNVVLQCSDCDFRITGTHDNQNFEAVIDAICFTTGLKVRQEGNMILLYNNLKSNTLKTKEPMVDHK